MVCLALIVTIAILGAIIGSLLASPLSDNCGRKVPLYVADIGFIVGCLIMALAPMIWVLVVGRFIIGICVGICIMIVPVYLSEMVPSQIRGGAVAGTIFFLTFGQVIAYVVGLTLAPNWRLMLGLGAIPAVI